MLFRSGSAVFSPPGQLAGTGKDFRTRLILKDPDMEPDFNRRGDELVADGQVAEACNVA